MKIPAKSILKIEQNYISLKKLANEINSLLSHLNRTTACNSVRKNKREKNIFEWKFNK